MASTTPTSSSIPSNECSFLSYNSELRLLICSACRYALILSRLDSHLRKQHSLEKKAREPFLLWANSFPASSIIDTEATLQATEFPRVLPPISGLGIVQTNGIRCNFDTGNCFYIVTTLKKLREHLSKTHGWVNTIRGDGKPPKAPEGSNIEPYRGLGVEGIPYTRLFPSGVHSGLFEVAVPAASERPVAPTSLSASRLSLPTTSSRVESLIQQFEAPAATLQAEEQRRIHEQGDFLEPNAWLTRLGASSHLSTFSGRKDFILSLLSLPTKVRIVISFYIPYYFRSIYTNIYV